MKRQWTQKHDAVFAEAVDAIEQDMRDNGTSFRNALEHYAGLFDIEQDALRHEWNLRKEDTK